MSWALEFIALTALALIVTPARAVMQALWEGARPGVVAIGRHLSIAALGAVRQHFRLSSSDDQRLTLGAVEASRLDRVLVVGIKIPWETRDALLERLRAEGDAEKIIAAFQAVGATAPVRLTDEQKRRLLSTCKDWLFETRANSAPAGIYALKNALQDELA